MRKKKKPAEKGNPGCQLRDAAEEKLARTSGAVSEMKEKTPEELIHELRVHQIELEMQNEELKKTQLVLEECRDRYVDLYDFAPVGYFTFTRGGRIAEVNLTGAALLGGERQELLNRGYGHFVAPEDFDRWERHLGSVYKSEEKQSCDLALKRKDGATFHARLDSIRMDLPTARLPDGQKQADLSAEQAGVSGETPVIRTAVSDITERKHAEEELWKYREHLEELVQERTNELRMANEHLRQEITERKRAERATEEAREYAESIVETVREPLMVLDTDLKVISANHSLYQTFQVSPEDTKGKLIYDLGNRQWNISKLRVLLQEIISRDKQFQNFEVEHEFPTIGRKIMLLNARQVYSRGIGAHMILLAIEDVTERRRAEVEIRKLNEELKHSITQLRAANKELEAFSYSISHDLRAPLRSLDGFSQVLLEDYANQLDEQGKDYLQRIRKASQHMAELIDALFMLSRLTRKEMHYETVDLSTLAQATLAELRQTQPKRQIEVVIEEGLVVKGDPELLRVVMGNLLANAWKYTSRKPEPRIEVGALRQEDGKRTYFVRDNGAGFDMAFADKLFKAFQRLHTPNEFPGLGIGLATVQRTINRHGGRIWAEGKVGEGASFYFTLPRGTKDEE
jgi:PAS domain S-box-containing protein